MPRPLDTCPQHKIRVKSLTNEKKRGKKGPKLEKKINLKQKIKFEAEKNETKKKVISMKTNNLFKLFLYQKEFQLQITFLKWVKLLTMI